MTKPLLLPFGEKSLAIARRLALELNADLAEVEMRRFPDGETYVRIDADVAGRGVLVVSAMTNPDEQTLPLLFLAETLRELEAETIVWVTPYLPYMRQDSRFHAGEALTSRSYGRLISAYFDGLVTVDPHLHRLDGLDAIYTIPSRVVQGARAVASWLAVEVPDAFLVGPDAESEQWVSAVAALLNAPFVVLEKVRSGDRDVAVTAPDELVGARGRKVVVLDDIISTGGTMIETIEQLGKAGVVDPLCIGIHALFAPGALEAMHRAGASRVVTCNTIEHTTNAIDVTELLAEGVRRMLSLTAPLVVSDGVA